MNSVGGLALGLINAALIGVALLLLGVIIWFGWTKWVSELPQELRKLYIAFVALVVLYHVVAAFVGGIPYYRVIGSSTPPTQQSRIEPARGQIANPPPIMR